MSENNETRERKKSHFAPSVGGGEQGIAVSGAAGGATESVKGKSKSIGTNSNANNLSGERKPETIKLPICPEGQITTANQTPCERRGQGGRRRKAGFRVPLKREDGNMEAQIIEYNCEFPNRVAVRLEYLMQSTKVRLNDKHYMDDFYGKLLEEERRGLRKATRHREKMEQARMKKLIIDGINKEIPPELAHLHKHPVFRVNQMLGRLKDYDKNFAHVTLEDGDEITPIEPYEFNGNKFFKHVHDTGELWVPSAQRLYDDNSMDGKIYRAKLRLLQKRKEAAAEDKILRILNDVKQSHLLQEEQDLEDGTRDEQEGETGAKPRPSWLVDFEKEKANDDDEDEKLNKALKMEYRSQPFSTMDMAVDKIRAKTQKMIHKLNEKIQRSKQRQMDNESFLEQKRQEQEINYLDTFNYDKARIISNFQKRQQQGQVDDLLNRKDEPGRMSVSKGKLKPFQEIFAGPLRDKMDNTRPSTKYANEPLFTKLQKVYGVASTYPFRNYESYENKLMLDYFDNADNGKAMIELGGNVADMYTRQLMVADDHVKRTTKALHLSKK